MIKINLLPFRIARKKENIRRQISVFLLSFVLVTLIMIYYNMRLNNKIQDINNKTDQITRELARFNKINTEIEAIKKRLALLKKKTGVIKNLDMSRKDSVLLLDVMTEAIIEKKMWLTLLETKEKTVNINGIALDNKTVADFMKRLEDSELFTGVELKSTKQYKSEKNINLKNFVIICDKNSNTLQKNEL